MEEQRGIGNIYGHKAGVLAQDKATVIYLTSGHAILVSTHLVVTNGLTIATSAIQITLSQPTRKLQSAAMTPSPGSHGILNKGI